MNKISFIIPNVNNNEKESKKEESKKQELKENNINDSNSLQTNKQSNKQNITNYTQIAPNVYSFNGYDKLNNIYILYNEACQTKKENKLEALEMFKECLELINESTKKEIIYEIFINLALLVSQTNSSLKQEVANYYEQGINIFSDRAEPYFYWSIYSNKLGDYEKSYDLLNRALLFSYDEAKIKYPETQFTAYGKYLYNELSIACCGLKKYNEGKMLLEKIIDDDDLINIRDSIKQNLENIDKNLSDN